MSTTIDPVSTQIDGLTYTLTPLPFFTAFPIALRLGARFASGAGAAPAKDRGSLELAAWVGRAVASALGARDAEELTADLRALVCSDLKCSGFAEGKMPMLGPAAESWFARRPLHFLAVARWAVEVNCQDFFDLPLVRAIREAWAGLAPQFGTMVASTLSSASSSSPGSSPSAN